MFKKGLMGCLIVGFIFLTFAFPKNTLAAPSISSVVESLSSILQEIALLLSQNKGRSLAQSGFASGVIAAYSFDEMSGATVSDASGNGNNGTIDGATWISGKYGGALQFDGLDDSVLLPAKSVPTQITVSMWINPQSPGENNRGFFFSAIDPADNMPFHSFRFTGTTGSTVRVENGLISPTNVLNYPFWNSNGTSLNSWQHVAFTYDASLINNDPQIYINGISQSVTSGGTPSGSYVTDAVQWIIGNNPAKTNSFKGLIDEVRIYNRVLSQAEIQSDMNSAINSGSTTSTPPPPPTNTPTVTISANPTSVTAGSPSTITWSSTNATSCTASNGWTGTKGTSGTQSVTPSANTTYTLTCTGTGGSATQYVTILATPSVTPNPISVVTTSTLTGYDPLRFGNAFLGGFNWNNVQPAVTSAQTRINLNNVGQGFTTWGGPALVNLVPDPLGKFGQVLKITNPAATTSSVTSFHHEYFKRPTQRYWMRYTMLLDGNGNTNGNAPTQGGPYNGWFSSVGSLIPGGSTTYKMSFGHNTTFTNRMELVLMANGHLVTGSGHLEPGKVETSLQSIPGCAPVPAKSYLQFRSDAVNSGDAPHDWRGTKDWYEFYYNYEVLGPSTYLQRYFMRRLTHNGVWSPWQYPVWTGMLVTNGTPKDYHMVQITGNKSQSNDGPNDMYVYLGPYEITDQQDPYGFDCYGKSGAVLSPPISQPSQSTPTPPVVNISVNPTSITIGQSSSIVWSSTNATSCTASNGWVGNKTVTGNQTISPSQTTTYTISCNGAGGTDTKSITVTVSGTQIATTTNSSTTPTSTSAPSVVPSVQNNIPIGASGSQTSNTTNSTQTNQTTGSSVQICAQVMTWAKSPTGQIREFPNSCIPSGWVVITPQVSQSLQRSLTNTAQSIVITKQLYYGVSDPEVSKLQEFLRSKGYLNDAPSGYFGPKTLQAVKLYQTSKGIEATGAVGPQTRKSLSNETLASQASTPQSSQITFSKTLYRGFQGEEVKVLQSILTQKGFYSGEITGYFGPLTEAAVKSFQKANGIVSEGTPSTTGYGLVGQRTRMVLFK